MKLVPASSLALEFSPLAACVGEKGWALLVTGILLLLEVSCPLGCGYFVVMESEKEKSSFQCCSLLALTGGEPRTLPRPLLETPHLLQQGPVNDSIDLCCLKGETEASREAGCEHICYPSFTQPIFPVSLFQDPSAIWRTPCWGDCFPSRPSLCPGAVQWLGTPPPQTEFQQGCSGLGPEAP